MSSEHLYFWLIALKHISAAEASLSGSDSLIDRLEKSMTYYQAGITALKVEYTNKLVLLN